MNEITKATASALVKPHDDSMSRSVGGTMVKTGAVGGGLYLAAGLLPFINFPVLLIIMIVLGGYLYLKD